MAERYCTNCGTGLGPNDAFCASCGKPTHEAAAVATPEANVNVPRPRGPETSPSSVRQGRIKNVVKVDRLDKIVGLILAVIIGVPLLLAILWFVLQFFAGFLSGLFGP